MKSMDELKAEEDALRDLVGELGDTQRRQYYEIEPKLIKDPDTYAVLNYFFLAGLHHFYLGKNGFGALNLFAMLLGIFFIESFGIFIILAVAAFELPQLFRSQRIVQHYNNEVMRTLLNRVHDGLQRP